MYIFMIAGVWRATVVHLRHYTDSLILSGHIPRLGCYHEIDWKTPPYNSQ